MAIPREAYPDVPREVLRTRAANKKSPACGWQAGHTTGGVPSSRISWPQGDAATDHTAS